jgi:hypothetical protein
MTDHEKLEIALSVLRAIDRAFAADHAGEEAGVLDRIADDLPHMIEFLVDDDESAGVSTMLTAEVDGPAQLLAVLDDLRQGCA